MSQTFYLNLQYEKKMVLFDVAVDNGLSDWL